MAALAFLVPLLPLAAAKLADSPLLQQAITWEEYFVHLLADFWDLVGPGGKLHPAYLLEHKAHLVIEALLLVTILALYVRRTFKPKAHSEEPLTEKEACAETIEKYGVGSCGPRGFYGTVDVHTQLEEQLAQFMGTEEAIIYSFDIATVASIIPAFASRKDTLVVDEYVSYPIQQGCSLSRAKVVTFKHNDMADLERVLKKIEEEDRKERKPLTRRYVVVESVYANYGDLAPLDKIVELKDKYRYRLIVEESYGFGVLGATGRGACQHFGLKPEQVEIICASMGNALGSVGGFCVGDHEMVDHQRLQGASYVYSASLPPFLSTAASKTLETMFSKARTLLPKLARITKLLKTELRNIPGLKLFGTEADDISPIAHLQLVKPAATPAESDALLQRICDKVLASAGMLLFVNPISNLDKHRPPSSIRIFSNVLLEDKEVTALATALRKASKEVLGV